MNNLFLSIIIPVYNAERYLRECLDSCLAQDLPAEDYEIICVNDGSRDRSPELLRSYGARYSNITVIDQPNRGVSAARNTGLELAKGDFIWFIDADDLIRPRCLQRLRDAQQQTRCDRLTFHDLFLFTEALSEQERRQYADGTLRSNGTHGDGVIWSSLFRRSLLQEHQVRFREGVAYGEDLLFLYEWNLIPHEKSAISDLIYLQRLNAASAVANSRSRRSVDSDFLGAAAMKSHFDRESLQGVHHSDTCFLLSYFLKNAVHTLAYAERTVWDRELTRFRAAGLFPLQMPRGFKAYSGPITSGRTIASRIYNRLYRSAYTVPGAWMLRAFCQARCRLKRLMGR